MPSEWVRASVRGFKRYYNPEVTGMIRMDTNTNVLGSNPAAMRFLSSGFGDLNEYPNTYSDGLRDALASLYGLERENFVCGSGSDEAIDIAFKTFMDWGDCVNVPVPSYSLYDYFVSMNGGRTNRIMLADGFRLDTDAMLAKAKMIIVPSPNNPTGNSFREKDLTEILERFDGPVIIDEAYGEYAGRSMIPRVNEFSNLIVMRTFSKAYAMAALRVGYSVSNLKMAGLMNNVKIPYSLNSISEGAAIAAVKDQDFIERSVSLVNENRPGLSSGLKRLGFEPFPSDANFILARCPVDHAAFTAGLKKKGILIRDFGSVKGTENCIRTTIGTKELNDLLLRRSEKVISECR
jgi:histidinol-phosphate aminotransferase